MMSGLRLDVGLIGAVLIAASSTLMPAMAADMQPPMPTKAPAAPVVSPWTVSVTPYVWAPSLKGSLTVKGRTTDVDASFVDLLEHSKFPKDLFDLGGHFEARNDRFSIFSDVIYLKARIKREPDPDARHRRPQSLGRRICGREHPNGHCRNGGRLHDCPMEWRARLRLPRSICTAECAGGGRKPTPILPCQARSTSATLRLTRTGP